MITITKRSATPPQPYESQTYARREDEAFTTKDAVFAVRQKVARPAHWIPGPVSSRRTSSSRGSPEERMKPLSPEGCVSGGEAPS